MAETFIPPWLNTAHYDPVGTYLRAFQTGAQISEAQTRLAEQQRQANMEAMARQEQLQSTMLRAMTETAVQKAYQEQQISLRQQDLAQEKARNDALAKQAADSLAARIRDNAIMQALRERDVAAKEQAAELGKIHFGPEGEVLQVSPEGGVELLRERDTSTKATMGEAALAREEIKKKMEERDKLKTELEGMSPTERTGPLGLWGETVPKKAYAETQKKISDLEREIAGTTAKSVRPAPAAETGRLRVKSPSGKIGTIPASQRREAEAEGYTVLE